ncbi:unnamed protein product, partial [Ectocarpus sp. 6 AP-2014]
MPLHKGTSALRNLNVEPASTQRSQGREQEGQGQAQDDVDTTGTEDTDCQCHLGEHQHQPGFILRHAFGFEYRSTCHVSAEDGEEGPNE